MKKLLTILVVAAMMITFAVTANAAFGTVVEAQKVATTPNLNVIDASWGDPVATNVTSATENTYLWHYWSTWADKTSFTSEGTGPNGRTSFVVEDNPFDIYMCWDDNYFYFGVVAEDYDIRGYGLGHHGDGIQLWFQPADSVDDPTIGATTNHNHSYYNPYWYNWSLDFDDWSTSLRIHDKSNPNGHQATQMLEIPPIINADPTLVGDNCFHAIIAIPWSNLYPRKADVAANVHNGAEFAIAFLRISATSQTCVDSKGEVKDDQGYCGGLCWGRYWQSDPTEYAEPTNKSLNTVVLIDPNAEPG